MKAKSQYICRVLVVLSYFSIWLSNSAVAAESVKWRPYDEGVSLGRIEKKKIFLHFYANWCFFCRKMVKETFQDRSVVSYLNENFVSIRVDSDKDRRTASMYGVRALPSTWFLTEEGERIGNLPGYIPPDQFLQILKRVTAIHDNLGKAKRAK